MTGSKTNITPIRSKPDISADIQNNPPREPVKKHGMDYALFIMICVICAFGLIMLFSASYYYAQNQFGDGFKFIKSQSIYVAVGIALMFALSRLDFKYYKNRILIYGAYIFILIMLVCVFLPGLGIVRQGARRWIKLGGITFQPSELVKFWVVLLFAEFMSRKSNLMPYFLKGTFPLLAALGSIIAVIFLRTYKKTEESHPPLENNFLFAFSILAALSIVSLVIRYLIVHKEIFKILRESLLKYSLIFILCIAIYKQPNLSMLILILLIMLTMLFIGGASWKYLLCICGIGLLFVLIMIFSEGYRSSRIQAWLHPWDYTNRESFQVVQSFYALGSGGLFGQGLNASKQKLLFLPYSESDFIFPIICEELGFVGGFSVIAAYGFVISRGIRIARTVRDRFASLLATGITAILAWQVFLNISVVTGMLPATGQTLPFISSGGTSVVVFLAAMGILLNISRFTETEKR